MYCSEDEESRWMLPSGFDDSDIYTTSMNVTPHQSLERTWRSHRLANSSLYCMMLAIIKSTPPQKKEASNYIPGSLQTLIEPVTSED